MKYLYWGVSIGFWGLLGIGLGVPVVTVEQVLPQFAGCTLYVSDLCLLLLGLYGLRYFWNTPYLSPSRHWSQMEIAWLGLLLLATLVTFWSVDPFLHFLLLLRFLLLGVGLSAVVLGENRLRETFLWSFVGFVLAQGVLALFQVLLNHSLGLGVLGEAQLAPQLYNVAKIWVAGQERIRGYGTLAHPNILGAYALTGLALLPLLASKHKNLLALFLGIVGVLSFSKTFLLGLVLLVLLRSVRTDRFRQVAVRGGILLGVIFVLSPWIWGLSFIYERVLQWGAAALAVLYRPWGGGFGSAVSLQDLASPFLLDPWTLQPVHNIWMLAGLELGLLASLLLLFLWWKSLLMLRRLHKAERLVPLALLLALLLFGMVDHFYLTMYEGQVLFVFTVLHLYRALRAEH